jgi:hypothetical protein
MPAAPSRRTTHLPRLKAAVIAIALAGDQALATSPASNATRDPVVSRGLAHSTQDQALVEAAIDRANLLLSTAGRRLRATWRTASEAAAGEAPVPVYLVSAPADAAGSPAAVPRGCACIFVNPSLHAAWVRTHSTGPGRLQLDSSYLLTFMLLHEVGHIAEGSPSGEFSGGELSALNIEPTLAKANEEKADEFAAGLIRHHAGKLTNVSLAANWVAMELTKLGWNMQAYRTLDEFGASATGKPAVFFDAAYSHPNLAWRMLRSNHLIQQSTATKQLLEAFEEARRRAFIREVRPSSGCPFRDRFGCSMEGLDAVQRLRFVQHARELGFRSGPLRVGRATLPFSMRARLQAPREHRALLRVRATCSSSGVSRSRRSPPDRGPVRNPRDEACLRVHPPRRDGRARPGVLSRSGPRVASRDERGLTSSRSGALFGKTRLT